MHELVFYFCYSIIIKHSMLFYTAYGVVVSVSAVVTFILTLILYTPLLLLVVYCVYRCRGTNNTK